jgi:hypothetical protein
MPGLTLQFSDVGLPPGLPPKDDSYRSPNWEPCLRVDLPPFLAELLARQIQAQRR